MLRKRPLGHRHGVQAACENRFCHFYSQKSACLMSMLSAILNDLEDELPP
jgi:hypothetical protein